MTLLNKEDVHKHAQALFEIVKEENAPTEIKHWLEQVAQICLTHIAYVDELEDEDITEVDQALLSVMEPYLFLLGVVIANQWLDRMDNKEH